MKKLISTAFCCSLFAACGGNVQQRQSQNTISINQNAATVENAKAPPKLKLESSKFVNFIIGQPDLRAGSASTAEIKLRIQEPYHINSNPPSEKSFIPLEIIFEGADGILVGKPVYPKGELKKFAFSEDKLIPVYTGEISVKVPFRAGKSVVTGQKTLSGKLRFQPCDEEVCYPPQTIDVNLPVTIN